MSISQETMAELSTDPRNMHKAGMPDLYFSDEEGEYKFDPNPDINSYELALIMRLFISAWSSSYGGKIDITGFIQENNLQHHFSQVG